MARSDYPPHLTVNMLLDRSVCLRASHIFRRHFPDGFDVTAANIVKATEVDLDVIWAAKKFLPRQAAVDFVLRILVPLEGVHRQSYEKLHQDFLAQCHQLMDDYAEAYAEAEQIGDRIERAQTRTDLLITKEGLERQAEEQFEQDQQALIAQYARDRADALIAFLEL